VEPESCQLESCEWLEEASLQASFETQHLPVKRSHPSHETKLIQHDIQLQHLLCLSVQSSPEQRVLDVLLISGKGGYWEDNGLGRCESVNSPESKKNVLNDVQQTA
jgi:hypothetical protein